MKHPLPDRPVVEWINGLRCLVFADGRVMPIVSGGQEDTSKGGEGDDETEDDDDEEDDEDDEDEDDEDDDSGKNGDDKTKDPEARIKSLTSANERLAKKLKNKDKDISKLQKDVKDLKDSGKSGDDKTKDELREMTEERDGLAEDVTELKAELLVLNHDKLATLPPARRQVILSSIAKKLEIDEDDDSNLDELLEELEEGDPSLFESPKGDDDEDEGEEDDNDEDDKKKGKRGKTRAAGKKRTKKDADEGTLRERFPALKRRGQQKAS